ncbi:2Fe-2S iron-sulfur cluster-binding protein [Rhodococcoides kyotonense]|uniref:Ferredoxin, 2Fe-2S n=1 Tax=Rhodococcoides kyotonense TaxID=398843 RepID=A0A239JZY4_9NOCA|nr:2Fe-2S iron-sulfur cluster-binding protein [Rhodococcus kyotonensis]SNT11179.1 ferredoxin, 2Fe-2S [Rhodococcus kyotonensis]
MSTVVYRLSDGSEVSVDVPSGQSVMDGSVRNNLPGIIAECGGSCSCATCHVYLDDHSTTTHFDEPSLEEQDLIEFIEGARPCSRLACQLIIGKDTPTVHVTVPGEN